MKYAYQRAKELCKEKGFDDYMATNAESGDKPTSFHSVPSFGRAEFDTISQTTYSLDVECRKK